MDNSCSASKEIRVEILSALKNISAGRKTCGFERKKLTVKKVYLFLFILSFLSPFGRAGSQARLSCRTRGICPSCGMLCCAGKMASMGKRASMGKMACCSSCALSSCCYLKKPGKSYSASSVIHASGIGILFYHFVQERVVQTVGDSQRTSFAQSLPPPSFSRPPPLV